MRKRGFHCHTLSHIRNPNKTSTKKQKSIHLVSVVLGNLKRDLKKRKDQHPLRILLDSGTTATIIMAKHAKYLKTTKDHSVTWKTKAGTFTTKRRAKLFFTLPEFDTEKTIEWKAHVDDSDYGGEYDMIIGTDLMATLGIDLKYSTNSIIWDDVEIPMKSLDDVRSDTIMTCLYNYCYESNAVQDATNRVQRILDAKYEKADLDEVVSKAQHLNRQEREQLLSLLYKYEGLFSGKLGTWKGTPVDLQLKPGATPYHAKAFPVPKIHEATLRKEVDRLCDLGVLERKNDSEWAAPTFIIPKKNNSVRFISDFRELNKHIIRKPYPIPKIQELLLKLEGFTYASSIDLNMGYYHLQLTPNASRLCTIILPWGKYVYKRLPMGITSSVDIFQEKMNELFIGMEFVRVYLDDLLILTTSTWEDHLKKLERVLRKVQEVGLQVNAHKSYFGRSEIEYLGFWVTREGIRPITSKVDAMLNIAPPKTRKQLRRFIGLINYYKDMWHKRSETLAPLTALTSKTVKWRWTEVEQKAFDAMKKILGKEVLLSYPNFNKRFVIYTDASKTQLGAVITQDDKPVAFYSRKLSDPQTRYTTTERELLSIVETLKEYRTILLGQRITVYTDHLNLTHKQFNTERVIRWRLLLEEYGPELKYIKGTKNVIADLLSRLPMLERPLTEESHLINDFAEHYNEINPGLPDEATPVTYSNIYTVQQNDNELKSLLARKDNYTTNTFCGGEETYHLICRDGKIVIPKALQNRIVDWYHLTLCHPGVNRTEETIRQHFWWKGLRTTVQNKLRKCGTCQKFKKTNVQYGHLPPKQAEDVPWQRLCVDLIGPWTMKKKQKEITLRALTMIDPATGWFEVVQYDDKQSDTIADLTEQQWLSRYPWPQLVTYDRGSEFIGKEFQDMIRTDYGIKCKPISKRNPQANAICKRIHQVLTNMLRTYNDTNNDDSNVEDPWAGMLSAAAFAIRSTYHTTLKKSPGQIVFGRDMILNISHEANWKLISETKQKRINENNKRENRSRIPHEYHIGDRILIKNPKASKKLDQPWIGPYTVTEAHDNGTVTFLKGAMHDRLNIRQVKPYNE